MVVKSDHQGVIRLLDQRMSLMRRASGRWRKPVAIEAWNKSLSQRLPYEKAEQPLFLSSSWRFAGSPRCGWLRNVGNETKTTLDGIHGRVLRETTMITLLGQ
ncbi:hypothetical protein Aduo_003600 [Ancylostoma duodenale]